MFLFRENEAPFRRKIRYSKHVLRYVFPSRVRRALQRVRLNGFIPVPLPYWPYVVVVPTFALLSHLEYHQRHCDLSDFTGYCPKARTFWSLRVNYCPQCTLRLTRIRGFRYSPDEIVLIERSSRMIGPVPHERPEQGLSSPLPRDHIFPPMVAVCPF